MESKRMERKEVIKIFNEVLLFGKARCTQAEFKELAKMSIQALEQEPRKGHWVLTDVEGNKVWHCHCSECGKDPQDYVGGSENWWLIKSKLPKFCPNCGSDNREVVEE
jgi:rubrerythrin